MATETKRPNGSSQTELYNSSYNQTNNYTYVDESSANDSDFVRGGTSNEWKTDLYSLAAHSIPEGSTISKVTFYARFKGSGGSDYCKFSYKSGGTTYYSSAPNVTDGFAEYSWEQTTNQKTSAAWTRDDITNLLIGASLYAVDGGKSGWTYGYLSQLWIVVTYTEPPPDPPTNVAASENNSSKVVVTWTKSSGATGYKIYRDGNLIDTVGDVATYDDTGADAPVITPGSAVASDGTQAAHVALSLSGNSIANGTTHTYKVKATNAAGDSDDSATDTGYRLAGSLTYQWQRSAADSDADYSNIDGGTTASYNDTGAPADGSGRYFKCVLSATGSSNQTSAVDRGYRSAPAAPTNVAASENNSEKVVVTWTKSDRATGYKIYRDGALIDTVGDVATYDDTGAAAPVITPGSAVASDGTSAFFVELSISGGTIANGTTHTYKVKATNAAGDSDFSATDTGYRKASTPTFQWQRSADDSDADYANIIGGTTASYNDTGAPENGDGRYYKCTINAVGSAEKTTAADRGYRLYASGVPEEGIPMKIIEPIDITDDILTASNVDEDDYDEWESGAAYVVGNQVMVTVPNIHKCYECLEAQSAGLAADLLNEDCSDISDWTDADNAGGISEVNPAGQFRFYTDGVSGLGYAQRHRTIVSPPNTFTLEIKTYFKRLTEEHLTYDTPKLEYSNATWKFKVDFSTDGIFIYKASGAAVEVGTNILKYGASAAWQTWRFEVNKTTEASATVEVFLKEEGGVFVSQGTFDCDYEVASTDGKILIGNFMVVPTVSDYEFFVDYIKIGTGLGAFETTNDSPVGNTSWLEFDTTNRWRAFNGVLGSQVVDASPLVYVLTPGVVIDSVALLNIESTSVDIIEINHDDDLITNGTAWTGATGTTEPDNWDKVGSPADFTIDDGALKITADAANEGISQTFTVEAETEYQLVGKYKNTSGDVAQYAVYDVSNSADIKITTDLDSHVDFAPLSYVFTTPAGCTSIKISLMAKANGDIVWFDSIVCAPTVYSETVTTGADVTDIVKLDLVEHANCMLTVVVYNTAGNAKLGELIIGNQTTLGTMRYSPQIGITDYSTKTQDTYGNWTIVPRSYSKRLSCNVRISNSNIDAVFKLLSGYRSTLLVWVGDTNFSSLIVYGFYKDFQIVIPYPNWSDCALEIEGMI